MNTQDRAVVKALLQSMTERHLTSSPEFWAALDHFNITTTCQFEKLSPEVLSVFGKKGNFVVDVYSPDTTEAMSVRYEFDSEELASAFAANQRIIGDEPVDTRVQDVEAAHAEALEMDAEFNFEKVSRDINLGDFLAKTADLEPANPELLDALKVDMAPARAVIARALHVGANSWGGVIGEHEELVETLRNAGYPATAIKVDNVLDAIGGNNHKEIRKNWLEALRKVSSSI